MNNVIKFLSTHNIEYTLHEHPAVYTCDEAEKHCKHIPGIASKNLFLRSKKDKRNFLVVLPAQKQTNLKKFAKNVGENSVSFASSELLKKKLGLTPGSVSIFGLINNEDKTVEVYIDRDIYDAKIVSFHPNTNTITLELSKNMFHKFLQIIGHKINITDL